MVARADDALDLDARERRSGWRRALWMVGAPVRFARRLFFSTLTRRIISLNLIGLVLLLGGILYLNNFRTGLIDARVESLLTQGQIIAAALAASASVETDTLTVDPDKLLELEAGQSVSPFEAEDASIEFPINPERVAPILKRLTSPTRTRARIYDQEGTLLLDSRALYAQGEILRYDLPPPEVEESWPVRLWQQLSLRLRRGGWPTYKEISGGNGNEYPEVAAALSGAPATIVRADEQGRLIVSVAVPVQRFRAVLGALLLSTEAGDIDSIVTAERTAIVRVFIVAAAITVLLSLLLASTIAGPVRRLSAASDHIRHGERRDMRIDDLRARGDEIGHLARALDGMTNALYERMEGIERFAADVAHELKNPLTSLRSAVETLPLATRDDQRERLLDVIEHDVHRLDRLITDISDASRLDAELAREGSDIVDVVTILETLVSALVETRGEEVRLVLDAEEGRWRDVFMVEGHEVRLGQVFTNLIENALSFSKAGDTVRVVLRREGEWVLVAVEDEGPGVRAEDMERIFERFYTDRPGAEAFGQNSGLGLAISKQIVEAHDGIITVRNRMRRDGSIAGARFTVRLPAID